MDDTYMHQDFTKGKACYKEEVILLIKRVFQEQCIQGGTVRYKKKINGKVQHPQATRIH